MIDPNTQALRRKMVLVGSMLALLIGLGVLGWAAFDQEPAHPAKPQPLQQMMRPGQHVNDKEAFTQHFASQLKSVGDQLERLDGEFKKLRDEREAQLRQDRQASRSGSTPAIGLTAEAKRLLAEPLPPMVPSAPIVMRTPANTTPVPLPMTPIRAPGATTSNGSIPSPLVPPAASNTPAPLQPDAESAQPIRILRSDVATTAGGMQSIAAAPANPPRPDAALIKTAAKSTAAAPPPTAPQSFVPANTFVRAVLLNGLDAPTGGQAQSNPLPVSLHLLDPANLPSLYKLDVRDCRILTAAFGDLSSERALLRAETVTCVLQDGQVVEAPLRGSVIGEDGKVGVRGRLVTKQGQVLGNALLAGIASGMGRAFTLSSTTQTVTPLGGVQTVDPSKSLEAGMGLGVSRALDQLANYYIRAAEKLFPVIEVDGGRVVEILVTKGAAVPIQAGLDRSRMRALLQRDGEAGDE